MISGENLKNITGNKISGVCLGLRPWKAWTSWRNSWLNDKGNKLWKLSWPEHPSFGSEFYPGWFPMFPIFHPFFVSRRYLPTFISQSLPKHAQHISKYHENAHIFQVKPLFLLKPTYKIYTIKTTIPFWEDSLSQHAGRGAGVRAPSCALGWVAPGLKPELQIFSGKNEPVFDQKSSQIRKNRHQIVWRKNSP